MTVETKRKTFPADITFCYPWRTYQKRILDELDDHLANKHLHLVAPPGSGKTVLGLEVMLRLNKPTIILAPTLTIKNQWEERFTELFLQAAEKPDWISMHIKEPKFVTITTYQALYSLYSAYEENKEEVIVEEEEGIEERLERPDIERIFAKIDEAAFETIVLDEAHHLRTAWWKATMAFKERLENCALVALTATPPYDVTIQEWERYEELCGPIDAEIHVAELVREGDLCPHQDYIYLSEPSKEEKRQLKSFHRQVKKLYESILESSAFSQMIQNHDWVKDPVTHREAILSEPGLFSSFIIYLHHKKEAIHKDALAVLALKKAKIPKFTLDWAEVLLNGMRQDDYFEKQDIFDMEQLEKDLKQIGALEKGKVYLYSTPSTDKKMMQSTSKFSSIEKIVHIENRHLGDDLRMVILTDYIRKEMLANRGLINHLGVVPIFQMLHQSLGAHYPLAVLTGSLVIIPKSIRSALASLAEERQTTIQFKEIDYYDSFVMVNVTQSNRAHIVAMMTELFTDGHVRILIGTAALLGEGWDAPCINSFIMASYVGSFMLSNQMRGRAIRTDSSNPEKTSTIWHLACIDLDQPYGGYDMLSLRRRFRSIVGLHARLDAVETGISRLGNYLPFFYTSRNIKKLNKETIERASNREALASRWKKAVYNIDGEQEVQLRMDRQLQVKPFVFPYTIKALMYAIYYTFLTVFTEGIYMSANGSNLRVIRILVIFAALVAFVSTLPKLWKLIKLIIRFSSLEKYMKTVGEIVYDTLYELGHMESEKENILIDVEEIEGILICKVRGGKTFEKHLLMDTWTQLMEPIQNPRYILKREPKRILGIKRKADYLAVPEELGKRKEDATLFCEKWNEKLELATLHYTRASEGRAILVQARIESFVMQHDHTAERISVWK